jgi:hypothetical protein
MTEAVRFMKPASQLRDLLQQAGDGINTGIPTIL